MFLLLTTFKLKTFESCQGKQMQQLLILIRILKYLIVTLEVTFYISFFIRDSIPWWFVMDLDFFRRWSSHIQIVQTGLFLQFFSHLIQN